MTDEWDVVVIGGGPAGATAGQLLARAGRRTLLLDRDTFPRDKVCGEFLSWDALPILDVLGAIPHLDLAGCPEIDTCRIVGERRSVDFTLPGVARGVSRVLLDALLVRLADEAGCSVLPGHTVSRVTPTAGGFSITVRSRADQAEGVIHARHALGAWGRWGRLDQELGRSFIQVTERHFGFKRHARPLDYERPSRVIELHSFRGGYLGLSTVEGEVSNICGLVRGERLTARRGGWDELVGEIRGERRSLEKVFGGHESRESFLSSDPVIFSGKEPSVLGIPLLGDSSGMVDPLTGNGMAMAIQSGALAFCSLLESGGADWDIRWRATFLDRIRWSRLSALMLTRPRVVEAGLRTGIAGPVADLLARGTRLPGGTARQLADRVSSLLRRPVH